MGKPAARIKNNEASWDEDSLDAVSRSRIARKEPVSATQLRRLRFKLAVVSTTTARPTAPGRLGPTSRGRSAADNWAKV